VDYTYAVMLSESFFRYSFTRLTEDNTPTRKRVLYFNFRSGQHQSLRWGICRKWLEVVWWSVVLGSGLWEVRQSGSSYNYFCVVFFCGLIEIQNVEAS